MTKKIGGTLERIIREKVAQHEEQVRKDQKDKLQAGALAGARQEVSKIPVLHPIAGQRP